MFGGWISRSVVDFRQKAKIARRGWRAIVLSVVTRSAL